MRTVAAFLLFLTVSFGARAEDHANWYQVRDGKWEVPAAVVTDIYPLLQASADKAPPLHVLRPMSDFTVQYQGVVIDNNVRLVRLNGACAAMGRSPQALRDSWLIVFDGGTCYFQATYDPATKRIVSFQFNAGA